MLSLCRRSTTRCFIVRKVSYIVLRARTRSIFAMRYRRRRINMSCPLHASKQYLRLFFTCLQYAPIMRARTHAAPCALSAHAMKAACPVRSSALARMRAMR